MKTLQKIALTSILGLSFCSFSHAAIEKKNHASESVPFAPQAFSYWSPKPPMGWNSYDAYHGVITEWQFKSITDRLEKKLLPHGYNHVVLDFLWYHPGTPDWDPVNNWKTFPVNQKRDPATNLLMPQLITDEYGRPQPALNRFPSAANNKGLKPLVDYVHSKKMKFGLHIMRGIPTQAVDANLPVLGTPYHMQDIAEINDKSSFLNGMFTGVKVDHPGAQAYYDSLFQQYADWGVDFVKADDVMRPNYEAREIELMRRAIDKTGRPMVLSLSYGQVSPSRAEHLVANANMWRVSADFWDRWEDLRRNFNLMDNWSPFIGRGSWPDADMIPIGRLMLTGWNTKDAENLSATKGREERTDYFTPAERQTLMTLWSITRSPLMWGGDPLSSSEETFALLSNPEVIAVNQQGAKPRQVLGTTHKDDSLRVWVSDAPEANSRYVALFNLREAEAEVSFELAMDELQGTWAVRNLWTHKNEGQIEGKLSRKLAPHASALFKITQLKTQ